MLQLAGSKELVGITPERGFTTNRELWDWRRAVPGDRRVAEIWAPGANRWRNPEDDLPPDFEGNRGFARGWRLTGPLRGTGRGQGEVRVSSRAARSGWAAARWGRVAVRGTMRSAGSL